MIYREIKPSEFLKDHIDSYWFFADTQQEAQKFRILPDVCMDIIIDLSDNSMLMIGVMTQAQDVTIKPDQKLFGIRFKPGVLPVILKTPAKLLQNHIYPLGEVDQRLERQLALIHEHKSFAGMARICDDIFTKEVMKVVVSATIAKCTSINHFTDYSVEYLAQASGVGQRQLERLFEKFIGLTPKRFLKIKRLQALHEQFKANATTLALLSSKIGYVDQAHMSREHMQLTLSSPKNSMKSGFYKTE